jgi:hypothetical protein
LQLEIFRNSTIKDDSLCWIMQRRLRQRLAFFGQQAVGVLDGNITGGATRGIVV